MTQILRSTLDRSTNFIVQSDMGYFESRYVRRRRDYVSAYLSSQSGCNQMCKFCHLTTSGQRRFFNADLDTYLDQLERVLDEYESRKPEDGSAKACHLNFMARGEPLANPILLHCGDDILRRLGSMVLGRGMYPKFNISTIMPRAAEGHTLAQIFPLIAPTIYYSLYSVDSAWRERWLPAAMDPDTALTKLAEWQHLSKKLVKIHGAFIAGENDRDSDVLDMMRTIAAHGLKAEFNIVAYNPYSPSEGKESGRLNKIEDIIADFMPVKRIKRVGRDVGASCGSFYPVHDLVARDAMHGGLHA